MAVRKAGGRKLRRGILTKSAGVRRPTIYFSKHSGQPPE
jgi:hypothetical protein